MVGVLDIEEMANQLKDTTAWANAPYPVYDEDYVKIVVHAIKKFFVDVNHPDEYDMTLYTTTDDDVLVYDHVFNILEEEYIFILCQMSFYTKILSEVSGSGAISYTTNALSVTGAKEGYKSVQQQLDTLEQERIRVFHKIMAHE